MESFDSAITTYISSANTWRNNKGIKFNKGRKSNKILDSTLVGEILKLGLKNLPHLDWISQRNKLTSVQRLEKAAQIFNI